MGIINTSIWRSSRKILREMAGKISENVKMVGELAQVNFDKAKLWKEVKVLQRES